jgi:hypothetical protein
MEQSKRQWLANTSTDPYKPVGFPVIKRSLTTQDYGNYVKINHGDGVSTLYAHLDEPVVYEGQNVKEGELIAYADSTGNSTGNHLHFEIRKNNLCIDPNNFDYSFTGKGGVDVELIDMQGSVKVSVYALNIRSGPARTYSLSGSKIVYKDDTINVVGYCKGEDVAGNSNWYKSQFGNYFWAGGTESPRPDLVVSKDNNMTPEENDKKIAEFEGRKAYLETQERELNEKLDLLEKEMEEFRAEYEAFMAEPVEEVTEAPEEEEVTEEVVEEPVTEEVEEVTEIAETEEAEEVEETEEEEVTEEAVVEETLSLTEEDKTLLVQLREFANRFGL